MTSVNARPAGEPTAARGRRSWLKRCQQRWLAVLLAHGGRGYDAKLAPEKRRLLAGLKGSILEIGPGPATNLRFYDPTITWIGVEPNPHLRRQARQLLDRIGVAGVVMDGEAESIPVPDESQDAVVSTLVLCSVHDVKAALKEVQRVLRPGGQFVFLEHVAAPKRSWSRRLQDAITPVSRCLGDGCHMNREPQYLISQTHFTEVHWNPIVVPMAIPLPHIAGIARK